MLGSDLHILPCLEARKMIAVILFFIGLAMLAQLLLAFVILMAHGKTATGIAYESLVLACIPFLASAVAKYVL